MKKFFLISYLLTFIIISLFLVKIETENPELIILKYQNKEEIKEKITLFFVGDIMLNRGVYYYIEKNNNPVWPFLKIADFLNQGDIVFGNLESIISDKGYDTGEIYSFRAKPETINGLLLAGFNIVSVANNHSFDYTKEAFLDSLKKLKNNNISYVGGGINEEEAFSPLIKEVKGTKIGFLGYTSISSSLWQAQKDSPGIVWIDINKIDILKENIKNAKEKTDFLIVSFHFGEEYKKEPNQEQIILSMAVIDSGADLVIGHHPHVFQPIEEYKNKIIAYSLGNFVFDQSFSEETMEGTILKIIIQDKEIIETKIIKTKLNKSYQVELKE